MTIHEFIEVNGITSSYKHMRGPVRSRWPAGSHHYSVTFHRGSQKMTTPFHKGPGLTDPPSTAEVLDSLAREAQGYEIADNMEDWMSQYGFENFSEGRKIYKAVEKQSQALVEFLGDDLYRELLQDVELE